MFQAQQIAAFRADTPGCANRIHFNNAGAALMPKPVHQSILDYLEREAQIGGYETKAERQQALDAFYTVLADFLHAQPEHIAWVSNATDAYNRALTAIPFEPGDVILTTYNDYVSNQIALLQLIKRFGVKVVRVPDYESSDQGGVNLEQFQEMMQRHQPKLVAVTHIPTSSGLIQPVEQIGRWCREHQCWYLVDACQSAGQVPLDVKKIGCDFLTASFRKFLRGPRGAGFLYTSQRVLDAGLEPLFMDLHGADWKAPDVYQEDTTAKRFELWERPYALQIGSTEAVRYAQKIGIAAISGAIIKLAEELRGELRPLKRMTVQDKGKNLGAIVSVSFENRSQMAVKEALENAGINASFTLANSARLDFQKKGIDWTLRLSPHYYNTEKEVSTVVETLKRLTK